MVVGPDWQGETPKRNKFRSSARSFSMPTTCPTSKRVRLATKCRRSSVGGFDGAYEYPIARWHLHGFLHAGVFGFSPPVAERLSYIFILLLVAYGDTAGPPRHSLVGRLRNHQSGSFEDRSTDLVQDVG